MESTQSSPAADRRRGAVARRHSAIVLAVALLFTSLFVDVGIARAEYPAGWQGPDLQALGACIGTCGSLFIIKGQLLRYAVGLSCLGCLWDVAVDINSLMRDYEVECWTGVLGQPCDGGYLGWGPPDRD